MLAALSTRQELVEDLRPVKRIVDIWSALDFGPLEGYITLHARSVYKFMGDIHIADRPLRRPKGMR